MKLTIRAFDGEGVAGAARDIMSRDLSQTVLPRDLSTLASKNARSRCRWVAIAILPRITVRPGAAPGEAEGRGSWADMVYCFQQLMRERVEYDACGGNQY